MTANAPRSSAPLALGLLGLLAACNVPQFRAERELDRSAPAGGLARLQCRTHNGAIVVRGIDGASEVRVHAALSARGHTQADADANVGRLDIALEQDGDRLTVRGVVPDDLDGNVSPAFSFTIEGPPALVAELVTHNGRVEVRGLRGDLQVDTHNGGITAAVDAGRIDLETHNGNIAVELAGEGPVRGAIVTHNGGVALGVGGRAAIVEASTHNGAVRAEGGARVSIEDRTWRLVYGDAAGESLRVRTHNGNVDIR